MHLTERETLLEAQHALRRLKCKRLVAALYSSLPNGDKFVPCAASAMQIHRLYGVPIPTLRAEHLFTPPPEALRNRRFLVGGEWMEYDPGVVEWVVRLNDGYCQERRRTDRSVAMQQERYKFVLDAIGGAVASSPSILNVLGRERAEGPYRWRAAFHAGRLDWRGRRETAQRGSARVTFGLSQGRFDRRLFWRPC